MSRYKFLVLLLELVVLAAPAQLFSTEVCLTNGDCLNGKIIDRSETSISLQHPSLGLITIPLIGIDTTVTSSEESVIPVVDETDQADSPPKWKHRVFLGVNGEEGNDVSFDLRTGFTSYYKDDFDRWKLESTYVFKTDDNEKDKSDGYFIITKDWFTPQRQTFYFVRARYDYDSFKYWKHRATSYVGPGYKFIDDDSLEVDFRLGVGGSKTWGSDNRTYPEGALGLETAWRPDEINELELDMQFYKDLDDLGEYRTFSKLEWRIKFNVKKGLSVRSAIEHKYESEINRQENNEKHYDLTYYWGVELEF